MVALPGAHYLIWKYQEYGENTGGQPAIEFSRSHAVSDGKYADMKKFLLVGFIKCSVGFFTFPAH